MAERKKKMRSQVGKKSGRKEETTNGNGKEETKGKSEKKFSQKDRDIDRENDDIEYEGESIYEINTIDDYFNAIHDVIIHFSRFIHSTDKTLSIALEAIRDMVPMILNGKVNYRKVLKILDSVNSSLRDYIKDHKSVAKKVSALNDALKNRGDTDEMIFDFVFRAMDKKVRGVMGNQKEGEKSDVLDRSDVKDEIGFEGMMFPSILFDDENTAKDLEEKFGIDMKDDEKTSSKDDKANLIGEDSEKIKDKEGFHNKGEKGDDDEN